MMDSLIAGLGNIGSSVASGAANSAISGAINRHNQKNLMDYQYQKQREFTKDQYSLMAKGMYQAGINPALALGGASPAQLSAAGASSSSPTGGVGSNAPEAQQARVAQQLAEGQLDIMSAQREKLEAETNSIISKTPGEVDKLQNENTKLKSDVALNNALMQNHEVYRRLMENNINLTTAKIVTEGTKANLNRAHAGLAGAQTGKTYLEAEGIKIDLTYAKDMNDVYKKINTALADKTGLDASNFGVASQLLGKALNIGAKLFGAKHIAKSFTSGDHYHINGHVDSFNAR